MPQINIRDQIANDRANARDRKAKIESGKTLFLQDYQNLERKLEKELNDPGLSFDQRQIRQNRLTDLKLRWQRNGIGDLDMVINIRDSLVSLLDEFAGLPERQKSAEFGETMSHVEQLDAIISAAKSKGLI